MTDTSSAWGAPEPTSAARPPAPGQGYGPAYGPAYGQPYAPRYGQPGPGQPGPGQPSGWPAPPSPTTDRYAIGALVVGLVPIFSVYGIVLGAIALYRIRLSGDRGKGLAIAGIVVGALWPVVLLIAIVAAAATSDPVETADGSRIVDVTTLRAGDCLGEVTLEEDITDVPLQPCTSSHVAEVFAVGDLPGGPWPGQDEIYALADDYCLSQFQGYVGLPFEESVFGFYTLSPLEDGWEREDDREVACVIDGLAGETGSVRDSRR